MKDKLSLSKRLAFFRSSVHLIEKGVADDNRIESVKKEFSEIKKYLSYDEEEWCQRVLFDIYDRNVDMLCDYKDALINMCHRRSIRKYSEGISLNTFISMVDHANYAPSSCNRQPMEYLLINNTEEIKSICEIKKQKFIESVPCVILALCNLDMYWKNKKEMIPYFAFMDSGISIQNLVLAGHYYNVGTCIVNTSIEDSKQLKEMFKIPESYRVSAIITAGKYDGNYPIPGRKDLRGMIHYKRFGGEFVGE